MTCQDDFNLDKYIHLHQSKYSTVNSVVKELSSTGEVIKDIGVKLCRIRNSTPLR